MTVLARLSTADVISIVDLIDDLEDPSPATVSLSVRLSALLIADAAFRDGAPLIGGDAA